MRYLLVINFYILLCYSLGCNAQNEPYKINITQSNDSVGLYNISYSIIDYNLSGLLIYKKINDSCYRAIITSEMGPKILDMYMYKNEYKLNYAIKQLNRKIIIKSFYNDLVSISGLNYREKSTETTIFDSISAKQIIVDKKNKIVISNNASKKQSNVVFSHKNKKELTIDYFYSSIEIQTDSIFLKHYNYKMEMVLRKIKF